MAIHADGQRYESEAEYYSSLYGGPITPKEGQKGVGATTLPGTPTNAASDLRSPVTGHSTEGGAHIDREHDVPLGAAALEHEGKFYGTAVDRRIPHATTIDGVTFDPAQFVHIHEAAEHPVMEDHIQGGMSELDAYHKAHDEVATPTEQKAVQEFASKNGKDPEAFWKSYQSKWAAWVKSAQEQDPQKVHPHTYLKPYEPEMKKKMESAKVA